MPFIRVAVTRRDGTGTSPADHEEVWIDVDRVASVTEDLGSDTTRTGGDEPVEHHPSIELTTSDGNVYLVPLGTFDDQASAFLAVRRFIAALAGEGQGP